MKIEKFFERVQRTKPKLSEFIYDKYLSDLDSSELLYKGIKFEDKFEDNTYIFKITFSMREASFDSRSLELLSDMIKRLDKFNIPNKKNIKLRIYQPNVYLTIKLSSIIVAGMNGIKSTDEYKEWYSNSQSEYIKLREEAILRKDMKKYNL